MATSHQLQPHSCPPLAPYNPSSHHPSFLPALGQDLQGEREVIGHLLSADAAGAHDGLLHLGHQNNGAVEVHETGADQVLAIQRTLGWEDGRMGWCCEKCWEGSWCPSFHMSFWFLCKKIGKSSKVGVFEPDQRMGWRSLATQKRWGMIGIETSKKETQIFPASSPLVNWSFSPPRPKKTSKSKAG